MVVTAFLSLVIAFGQAAAAGGDGPAVVSGRVVDARTGRPIAGVVIAPAGTAVPAPPSAADNLVLVRALTNGDGRFVIRGLRPGSLVLGATKGGYVDAAYGQRRPGGSAQPIPVKADDRINNLEIRMWKQASIAGTVLDDAGEPAVGARVIAYGRTFIGGRRRLLEAASAVTDDRGAYRVSGLVPGDYVVGFRSTQISVPAELVDAFFNGTPLAAPRRSEAAAAMNEIGAAIVPSGTPTTTTIGGQAVTLRAGTLDPMPAGSGAAVVFPTTFFPATTTAAQAAIVSLKSGDERDGVDIQVQAVKAVRVSGTLVGNDGSYTSVRLVPAAADDFAEALDTGATVTDVSGGFTFPAVPPGDYLLKVVRLPRPDAPSEPGTHITIDPDIGAAIVSGNVPTTSEPPAPSPIPSDATLCAQVPLSVGARAIDNLVVALVPGPRVVGRVEFDGTIDKPAGPTLTGMRIFLDPADGSRLPDRTLALFTGHPDENGEFSTYGVPPGRYVVGVGGPPAGWFLKSVTYQGRDISDLPIDLSADATGVVITYTDRPSTIAGAVTGPHGPDGDAVVIVYPVDRDAWAMAGRVPRRMRTARVKPTGDYTVAALPPGDYYVVAVKEDALGEWQDPALLMALTRVAQQVQVTDGERKSVNLSSAEIR